MFSQINSQIMSVSFGVYNSEEVKKLSVLEVESPQTFDALGHAIDGGLCDNAFGAISRDQNCKTCGLAENECCGHFGHISLPLPVFNPFLIKQLFQLLQMCCFDCHNLLFSAMAIETAIAQMEALSRGLDILVDELEELASSASSGVGLDVITMRQYIRDKLRQKIEEESNKMKSNSVRNGLNVRNTVEKQQNIFKMFMSGKLLKSNKVCQQCNARKQGMTVLNNTLIILNMSRSNLKKSTKKADKHKDQNEDKEVNEVTINIKGKSHLSPYEARSHLRKVWNNEKDSLSRIFPFLNLDINTSDGSSPIDVFFLTTITVPPNRYRPLQHVNGRKFESEHTAALSQIMIASEVLSSSLRQVKYGNRLNASIDTNSPSTSTASTITTTITTTITPIPQTDKAKDVAKVQMSWQKLQLLCNRIYDSDMDRLPDKKLSGIKQTLEKKEGLFRKHMMGKRVNFAARSVISPDPYIMADEIGVPLIFATNLSYPQPVTPWNVNQMKQMILNGPNKHPGALSIQLDDGRIIRLRDEDLATRKMFAEHLSNNIKSGALNAVKLVNRHLISGDALLLNRQPTLHKPSIMAHKARILPKEKTLRLHYANCKCYNADFDGDEMNAHFPQSELARSEAYNIASVNFQYLVPKDGTPLSGLIQDHIIAGVLLTIRGKFFSKGDYQELLYGALSFLNKPIKFLPPAIFKPKQLWSGKQIVSTLILNIVPKDKPLPTLSIATKISPKILQSRKPRKWTAGGTPLQLTDMCESWVIIRKGELICGIIDKVNLGPNPYGLIHCCYELYGGSVSSALLTSFARLCTNYLQIHHGFTLGILDILVDDKPNSKRKKYIEKSLTVGDKAAAEALGIDDYDDEVLLDKLKSAHTNKNDFYMKQLDKSMKGQTDEVNNKITEVCLPKGLIKQFPENNLQMMIQAGAKGGSVNAIQISCLLGQIELEGRRVPLMMSGRTLPSFKPYETQPKAGGFVSGRFMTGIRPQEFFFHCMAGREGLIDTAVKTSRSGYLQRCLIKHLEGLVVNYDLTVRDSEGSIVQLLYGEDGLDISKCQLLKEKVIPIVIQNNEALKPSKEESKQLERVTDKDLQNYQKNIEKWLDENGSNASKRRISGFAQYAQDLNQSNDFTYKELVGKWFQLRNKHKKKYQNNCKPCPEPINNTFRPDLNLGSITEKLDSIITNYINENPDNLLNNSCDSLSISSTKFRQIMNTLYMKSLCQAGEAVGLLAAQSVGEPSTQMTLNTFHFAGRGEMNVTLGIPRLREILMTASAKIATPSMDIPFRNDFCGDIETEAENIRLKLNSVKLSDVLESVDVTETLEIKELIRFRLYDLKFNFLPKSYYKYKCYTNPSFILKYMEEKFFKVLLESINKKIKTLSKSHGLFDHSSRVRATKSKTNTSDDNEDPEDLMNNNSNNTGQKDDEEEGMSSDEEDEEVGGEDTTASRNKSRHNQELEYEEPDDDEIQIIHDSDIEEITDGTAFDVNEQVVEEENIEHEESNDNQIESSIVLKKRLKQAKKDELMAQKPIRRSGVLNISPSVIDYDFDASKEEWCRIRIKFNLINSKLDMSSLIEEETKRTYVHKVGRIERAFLVKDSEAAKRKASFCKLLKTEGVSLLDVVHYQNIFDINRIYTNDIHAIANTYGIEAATKAIQREISNVFAVYGIYVDSRHLSLISDYMTFSGQIKGMNRQSMEGVSPIQAMTFETTTNFLKTAVLIGLEDDLSSPSARLVVGRPSRVGSGIMETFSNPVLMAGTDPQLSFGNSIRKTKWKNNSTLKRKYENKLTQMPVLNKRIKYNL